LSDRVKEADLVARAVDGDGEAFAELVMPFEGKVYGLAYRMCGNREDAYDLAQEAFLKVYRALGRFKGDSSFSTWLYRVVANTCLDQLRRAGRSVVASSLDDPIETETGAVKREVADTTFEPEILALQSEAARELRGAVAHLPPVHRLAILLRDYQDLPYEEIAEAMGCGLGTVKSRISRARAMLRDRLSRKELPTGAGVYSAAGPVRPEVSASVARPARGVDA
jgi:RNA polymerase sigma-70 factor (ECF subfamily)